MKKDVKIRVEALNKKLAEKGKKLVVISQSSVYTYNKGIALVDINKDACWYSVNTSEKYVFKTWNEAYQFLTGFSLALYL